MGYTKEQFDKARQNFLRFYEFPHTSTYDSDLAWLIANMKNFLQAFEEFLLKFEKLEEDMGAAIEALPGMVDEAMQEAIDDGRIAAEIDKLLEPVRERMSEAENRLDALEYWQEHLIIDNLESDDATKALSANMGRVLKEHIDAVRAQLASDVERLDGEVERLDGEVERLDNRITSEVQTLNERVDTEVQTLNNRVTSEVQTLNNTLNADVARLDAEDAAINDRIDNLSSTLDTDMQDIRNAIDAAINLLRSEIPPIVDNLGSEDANKTLSARQGKILKDLIDALTLRVAVNETDISNIKDDIVRLDAYDAVLLNKIDSGDATLDAKIDALDDAVDTRIDALRASIPTVVDTLNSTSLDDALSANMGRVLKEMIQGGPTPGGVTIIDNLTSSDANAALSANMGRELNEKIPEIIVIRKEVTGTVVRSYASGTNSFYQKIDFDMSDFITDAGATNYVEFLKMLQKIDIGLPQNPYIVGYTYGNDMDKWVTAIPHDTTDIYVTSNASLDFSTEQKWGFGTNANGDIVLSNMPYLKVTAEFGSNTEADLCLKYLGLIYTHTLALNSTLTARAARFYDTPMPSANAPYDIEQKFIIKATIKK